MHFTNDGLATAKLLAQSHEFGPIEHGVGPSDNLRKLPRLNKESSGRAGEFYAWPDSDTQSPTRTIS